MHKFLHTTALLLAVCGVMHAQQVIPLYPEMAADSTEKAIYNEAGQINVITGVNVPSLTVYLPDAEKATGTAIILCPGGGLRMLAWGSDVVNMARWLNERGIAAIGLKYRLNTTPMQRLQGQSASANPFANMALNVTITQFSQIAHANANPDKSPESLAAIDNALADVTRALELVRQHAQAWHIDPHKVGLLGFSAGGGVAIGGTWRESFYRWLTTTI